MVGLGYWFLIIAVSLVRVPVSCIQLSVSADLDLFRAILQVLSLGHLSKKWGKQSSFLLAVLIKLET